MGVLMVDMSSIAALAGALKTAAEITKTAVEIRDGTKLQGKIIELQSVILSAQSSALGAQQDQFELIEEVRKLKQTLAEYRSWDKEAEKYELTQIDHNSFAYMKKNVDGDDTPQVWLCTNCFEDKVKSILQYKGRTAGDRSHSYYECPRCKSLLNIYYARSPKIPYND